MIISDVVDLTRLPLFLMINLTIGLLSVCGKIVPVFHNIIKRHSAHHDRIIHYKRFGDLIYSELRKYNVRYIPANQFYPGYRVDSKSCILELIFGMSDRYTNPASSRKYQSSDK